MPTDVSDVDAACCVIAFLIGSFIGLVEFATQYRDPFRYYASSVSTWLYVVINGLISTFALLAFRSGNVIINGKNVNENKYALALVVGFSAMGVLRSSVVNVKHNGKDFNIGIHKCFMLVLKWVTGMYEAKRSKYVLNVYSAQNIPFSRVQNDILPLLFNAYTNISPEDEKNIKNYLKKISSDNAMHDHVKSSTALLKISHYCGFDVLDTVVCSVSTIKDFKD